MVVTEVRIKLVPNNDGIGPLRAFANATFDDEWVVRDMKVLEPEPGVLTISMPSRKVCDHCPNCQAKNAVQARWCNQCGVRLGDNRAEREEDGRFHLHADVSHPITQLARNKVEQAIIKAYRLELERFNAVRALV